MKISIIDDKIDDVWDVQKAKLLLRMDGLSGNVLTEEQRNQFEETVTLYIWEGIKKQFPRVKAFCTGRRGGFNKIEERNYNTPIISIHGSFYIQAVASCTNRNWIWEEVSFEAYRFEFNEEGYVRDIIVEAINKMIMKGESEKVHWSRMIEALNEKPVNDSVITIKTQGKDLGKVDLHKINTKVH